MKNILLRVVAATICFSSLSETGWTIASAEKGNCLSGWTSNGNSCYFVYRDQSAKRSFWGAKKWCSDHGAKLATVLSANENRFLGGLINKTGLLQKESFYIALRYKNNRWIWVYNVPFNYTNWFGGKEPNVTKGNGTDCVYYNHLNQWQLEVKCVTKKLFICKQEQKIQNEQQDNQQQTTAGVASKPTKTSVFFTSKFQPDESANKEKLEGLLASLEGISLNAESAKQQMKVLGAVLSNLLVSNKTTPEPQSIDNLSEVVKMSEKIGEVIVKGLKRGENITERTTVKIQSSNLVLGVDILPPVSSRNQSSSVIFPKDSETANTINLPASLIWKAQQSDGVSITSLSLPNVTASTDTQTNRGLNSGIISSTILFNNESRFDNLSEPLVIHLSQSKKTSDKDSRHCVFLDVKTDPRSWSTSGCVVHHKKTSHTVCHCYHMTSYAVLMDVHGAYESDVISDDHELALTTISIIGCLTALICYVILFCTFYFIRKRTETSSIHMNLAAAEGFATFFFLLAFPSVKIKEACFAIAVLLYYFQLASFCWMLIEGVNLLRGMLKVFRVTSRLRIYSLFAWGLPGLIVMTISIVFHHDYLRRNFCWLSHRLIWAFAGPVACILVVNFVVLFVAIKIVVRRATYKVKPAERGVMSDLQVEIRAAFKTIVILMPLLGLTWFIGFLSIHQKSLVFQYLFAVINSVQGLYFFMAQYCFDEDIKRNAHRASTRMKRLFSLSSGTKSFRTSSVLKAASSSDKNSGSLKTHNAVAAQPRIGNNEEHEGINAIAIEKAMVHQNNDTTIHESRENWKPTQKCETKPDADQENAINENANNDEDNQDSRTDKQIDKYKLDDLPGQSLVEQTQKQNPESNHQTIEDHYGKESYSSDQTPEYKINLPLVPSKAIPLQHLMDTTSECPAGSSEAMDGINISSCQKKQGH